MFKASEHIFKAVEHKFKDTEHIFKVYEQKIPLAAGTFFLRGRYFFSSQQELFSLMTETKSCSLFYSTPTRMTFYPIQINEKQGFLNNF